MGKTIFAKNGNVLSMERVFPGSPDKIWSAWADADAFASWWGPVGWETTVKTHDFAAGGELLYGMKCVDENQGDWFGQTSWGKMKFIEVNPKSDFTYEDFFCSPDGDEIEGMPSAKSVNTLQETEGGTIFRSVVTYETEAALKQVLDMGMEAGIDQTWDRLEDFLSR